MIQFAQEVCVPYLLGLPELAPHARQFSLVLVGSVASGLCRPGSDVDIAVLCPEAIFGALSIGKAWSQGRPTEVSVEGVQLHYFAITLEQVRDKARALDDLFIFEYCSAIALYDPIGATSALADLRLDAQKALRQRLEGKLDMLSRRARALIDCIDGREDVLVIAKISIEALTLALMVVALLDGVQFDPRKRLFSTALTGQLGKMYEPAFRRVLSDLGSLGTAKAQEQYPELVVGRHLEELVSVLSKEAQERGYTVGLPSPDFRHLVRL